MKKIFLIVLLFGGIGAQLIPVFRSGTRCLEGICFWGPNGHDGVWHLALTNRIKQDGLPPLNPVFAGERLKNYHWGYNFFTALMAKILPLAVLDLHFRFLPFLFSFLLGSLSFILGVRLANDFWVGFWFAFLNYFASSLGWLVTLWRDGSLAGESLFWAMQSISFLLNPPFAFSVIILFFGFYLWQRWEKNLNLKKIIILGIIFGSLLNIKAYASVLLFLSLSLIIVLELVLNRRINKNEILILLTTFLISILIWFNWQKQGDWPFVFQPLWFVRAMLESNDRFYWPQLARLWWLNQANWFWSPKFILIAILGIVLFLIGNFNSRLLGLLFVFKKRKKNELEKIFLAIVFGGLILPLVFIQKGAAWNTIQFLYYSLLFANWFLARFLADLIRKKQIVKLLLIVLPLLPANYGSLRDYFGFPPPAIIPQEEVQGLTFLEAQPGKVVLTYPYDQSRKLGKQPPLPLYLYETTSYVAAFSKKISFLEDEMNLEITGFPWRKRKKEIEQFFTSKDLIWSRGFLLNNGIDYIYLVDDQLLPVEPEKLGLRLIFQQKKVRIYQVLK